jgi:16S rRNA (adenine1518-N6/adenine1519-N6)-dimethyltransferase
LNIKNKKSLGQNFIFDKNFLKKISNFIETNSDNILIEIGPGPGTLTEFLYKKKFKKLILIEKDQDF